MSRIALTAASLLALATPGFAADLDGPYYRESYIERPAPPTVVERERIIERTYYPPPRVYREDRVIYEAQEYVPRGFVGVPVPPRYVYERWSPRRVIYPRSRWYGRHGWHGHGRW